MDSRDEAEPGNVESAGSDAGITIIHEPPQPPLATLQVQSDSAEPQPLQTTPESRRRSSFSFLSIFPSTTTKEGTTSNNTEQTTPEIPQPFSFMTRKSSLKDPSNLFERVHRASILGVPQLAAVKAMATLKLGAASNSKDEPAEPQTHNGWSGPKYGAADVTVRTKGRRTVYLLKAADVILFDRIAKWKTPKNTVEGRLEYVWFKEWDLGPSSMATPASSPDAFIKLHFGVLRYDYILKCVCYSRRFKRGCPTETI
ncbi:hypothetical protein BDR26DRAFT_902910 [Obelidium mucronatum]|nr:hypothetical protein BDR26DRAFT_902910 [Obelidium mucronatum]